MIRFDFATVYFIHADNIMPTYMTVISETVQIWGNVWGRFRGKKDFSWKCNEGGN